MQTKFNYIAIGLLIITSVVLAQPIKPRESLPHFSRCYTQGLIIQGDDVWESCGLFGESQLIHWQLSTQKIIQQVKFDDKYFAEGLTELNGKLYMLTWQAGVAFEIDKESLKTIKTFHYQGQGWGLTTDGKQLILSNGSDEIQFVNPDTFTVEHTIHATINNKPVNMLNELEWIEGKIYANVYQTDYIVVIDPTTGQINKKYHLPNLLKHSFRKPGVLNGIAYDKTTKKIWITGKHWSKMFVLERN
jgi:glutamine cyclotransferase